MKVGFELLPTALRGLGRISHLINVETVEDLVVLMRATLESTAMSLTLTAKLLCVHCALKTLAGPGEILEYDREVFIISLQELLLDMYGEGDGWEAALECVDLLLVKRREDRNSVVLSFVRALFLHVPHVSLKVAATILCLVNTVLLRYPRARAAVLAIAALNPLQLSVQEEEVSDLAMRPLQASGKSGASVSPDDDGSWVCPLLMHHLEERVRSVTNKVVSKSIVNSLAYRVVDVRIGREEDTGLVLDSIEAAFKSLPPTRRREDTIPKLKHEARHHAKKTRVIHGDKPKSLLNQKTSWSHKRKRP
jgi:hypothetical protein